MRLFPWPRAGKAQLDEPCVCLSAAYSLLCAGGRELEVEGWLWLIQGSLRWPDSGFRFLFYGIRVHSPWQITGIQLRLG